MHLLNKRVRVGLDNYSQAVECTLKQVTENYIVVLLDSGKLYLYPFSRIAGIAEL